MASKLPYMNIIELELLSDDLAETEKFYKKVLGLTASLQDKNIISFRIGYTELIFKKSDGKKPVYHFAIDVPNNRFEEARRYIKQHVQTIPVEGHTDVADFVNWDAKSFYFYDNNGNILECITRYANRAYDDEVFTVKSYISISEIGLVSNNVPELADTLAREHGVPVYKRQPRSDAFTVSGDDEGLFILAAKGRGWYPTQVKAQSFSTRILFMQGGELEHIIR